MKKFLVLSFISFHFIFSTPYLFSQFFFGLGFISSEIELCGILFDVAFGLIPAVPLVMLR